LDFGIAKIQQPDNDDPELTAPNLIIGTPQYMSPEQCSKTSEIDYRSDIYSFGVIVFEMLTGHVPFTGDSATMIMLKHLQEPPPSVLDERSDLPPAVGQAVARALSKRREDRPQSAGELAEALALAADTGGVQARAITAGGPTSEHDLPVADTNRIIVPTAAQDSRPTAHDDEEDEDESTIVSPSPAGARPVDVGGVRHVPPPAAAVARLNPWKIMIPAALLVLVVLGVFYVTQRDPQPAANESAAPLASDPNAQAVEPLTAPTGAAERDITPGSTVSPPSSSPINNATTGSSGSSSSGSTVSDPLASPSDIANDNSDATANDNTAQNDNATDEPEPSPTAATTRNDNQRRTPTPTPADDGEDPPPPTPTPRRLPTPARQSPLPLPSLPPPSGARTPDN